MQNNRKNGQNEIFNRLRSQLKAPFGSDYINSILRIELTNNLLKRGALSKLYKGFVLVSAVAFLTIETSAQKITDADLNRYVIAIDSIETLKNSLAEKINKLAKGNEKISEQRYTALAPIANDPGKLKAAKATPDEMAYVKNASVIQQEETRKFQLAYQAIISDYVGDAVFGKVRHALTVDTALRKKHDLLLRKRQK